MTRISALQIPLELAYSRKVLFAVELLDAVTLERVSEGIKIEAKGLAGRPILNSGGHFVWLDKDFTKLERLVIDPGLRPFESVERAAADITPPLETIELSPRIDYPFPAGITGLRGTLIESYSDSPHVPVPKAELKLQWLDENGSWHDSPTKSHTGSKNGDFVAFLRLSPDQEPLINPSAELTVRLRFTRESSASLRTNDVKLLQGRIANPTSSNRLIFVWDELLP